MRVASLLAPMPVLRQFFTSAGCGTPILSSRRAPQTIFFPSQRESSCRLEFFGRILLGGEESKLTWLALGEDQAALSRRVEQLIALPRPVKP